MMQEQSKGFRIFSPATLGIAAIVVFLIGITYFIARPNFKGRLMKEYYSAPLAQLQRSKVSPVDSLYLEGMRVYGQKDWSEAISIFSRIPTSHPYYVRSLYYTGHAFAGKGEYEKALVVFSKPELKESLYAEQAEWNGILMKIILKYPREEIIGDLKVIENNPQHFYRDKVKELLIRLK